MQCGGAVSKNGHRSDSTSHVSVTANTQTGSFSTGSASPTRRYAAHDGQRRHLLRAALSLHLHFQVFPSIGFDFVSFDYKSRPYITYSLHYSR